MASSRAAAAAAVALALVALAWAPRETPRKVDVDVASFAAAPEGWAVPSWAEVVGTVDVVDATTGDAVQRALERGEPAVLVGSPAAQWRAVAEWSPERLCERLGTLKGVQRTRDRSSLFVYEAHNRMFGSLARDGKLEHVSAEGNVEKGELDCGAFFRAERPAYASASMLDGAYQQLLPEIQPRAFMFVPLEGAAPDDFATHLSFSVPGPITGIHYDPSHNFFAQVFGCKRFLLAEASVWNVTRQFPFHHPSDRQSQLETGAAPPASKIRVRVADLSPGQVLLLPPYVFHRVAAFPCPAGNASVSVNTWSPAREQKVSLAIKTRLPRFFASSLDDEGVADESFRRGAAALYIGRVVSAFAEEGAAQFLQHAVVDQRYRSSEGLAGALGCRGARPDEEAPLDCPADLGRFREDNPAVADKIDQLGDAIVAELRTVASRAVAQLIVADWVEHVVTSVAGDRADQICGILELCVVAPLSKGTEEPTKGAMAEIDRE